MLFCCQCVTLFTQYHLVLCHTISHHPPDSQILALFQRFSLLTTQIFIYINFLYISNVHLSVPHLPCYCPKAIPLSRVAFWQNVTGRYLQWALFLSKVVKLGLDLDRSRRLPMNLTKFLRTATLWNTCERLLIFLIETVVDRCSIEWLLWKISKLTCQNVPKTPCQEFSYEFCDIFHNAFSTELFRSTTLKEPRFLKFVFRSNVYW